VKERTMAPQHKRFITTIEIEADKFVSQDEMRWIIEFANATIKGNVFNYLTYREEFMPGHYRGHFGKEENGT
jgi:hypothetical protein